MIMEKQEILKTKTELLCKGLYLDEDLNDYYKEQGMISDQQTTI